MSWKITIVCFLMWGVLYGQRRFRPYTALGVTVSVATSALPENPEGVFREPDFGNCYCEYLVVGDIKASYDYAPFKFLGLSTGGGLSVRGGKTVGSGGEKAMFYLNVPLTLQLKAGFFWLEPSLQSNLLFAMYDGIEKKSPADLDRDDLEPVFFSYSILGRFNLFKGLSLHLGYENHLTPIGAIQSPPEQSYKQSTTYYQYAYVLGVRYMFGEPEKRRR